MKITQIPLSVWNRALELYGEPHEDTVEIALARLTSAEGRKDVTPDFPGITAFAQSIAEHLSSGAGFEVGA
jgi:hypothetical protein